jgi:hypothetical protein
MSVATELRQFMIDQSGITIGQICQGFIPESNKRANGFIYFNRSGTEQLRTFERDANGPYYNFFDVEIYHEDIETVEAVADAIQDLDCYTGDFGAGHTQAFFVENQTDDYVPQVEFTDEERLESSFLSIEIRGYTGP